MPKNKPTRKTIEDAQIVFRNFAGREGKYNREGDRNFAVFIDDPKQVKEFEDEGWNVRYLQARDEGEEDRAYLSVSVAYGKGQPPRIVMITPRESGDVRTDLTEETVESLDWVEYKKADMVLNPYQWSVSGKSGVKAYLKTLFITLDLDDLEAKYADVPEAGEEDISNEF